VCSFVPFPTATTVPFLWFSFAVSGIKIPEAVLSLQQQVRLRTLSESGLMFKP
jgi:hypothetical protein